MTVLLNKARLPTAVLLIPVTLYKRDWNPNAALSVPVVVEKAALKPTAVF
jgi:hypothetical protein